MLLATLYNNKKSFTEDIQLWEQLVAEDRHAFSALFRKYYRPLVNYGLKLIPDEALVKDSIQELFFTIWEQRKNLSEVEYVRSYLYISLRRTVLRQAEIQDSRSQRDRAYTEEAFREMVNEEQLMMIDELQQEQKAQLREALDALSEREKEAVFLKFYSGLANAEIARVMKVSKQSVYNYIYRAIQALKALLDG